MNQHIKLAPSSPDLSRYDPDGIHFLTAEAIARREIPSDFWFVPWRIAQLLGEELPTYIDRQLDLNLPPKPLAFHDRVGLSYEEARHRFLGNSVLAGQVYRDFIPERNSYTDPGIQRLDLETGMVVQLNGEYMVVREPFTAAVARDQGRTLLAFCGDNRRAFHISKQALPQKEMTSTLVPIGQRVLRLLKK